MKDWITVDGWPRDPTADPNCPICEGTGVLICYPPPSGMQDVEAECYRCIKDRCEFSIRATEYLERR